jgi:hypothetical protein
MAVFDWIQRVESLSPAALTVMAQAIDPDDTDSLVWSTFFPRDDVDSIRITEVSDIDFRPVADNREWNASGRLVPLKVPAAKELKMVPTEAFFLLDELEMQTLGEKAGGNQQKLIDIMGADITERTAELARACYRRLEINAMEAWANGNARTSDPYGGVTTVSFGFDTDRYLTAGTAWDDGGVNAYELFLTFIKNGRKKMGVTPIGAVMRQATYDAIIVDAPNYTSPTSTIEMGAAEFELDMRRRLGFPFRIVIMEHSGDVFGDGGPHNYTRTDYWPAQHVALVPPGGRIGSTKFAPVLRAAEIDSQAPDAGIDQNGVTVYHDTENSAKTLRVEAQVNVFPIPTERYVYVTDAGV